MTLDPFGSALATIQASPGTTFSSDSSAAQVGATETELVFKILEHLAANNVVKKVVTTPWYESTFAV